MKLAQKTKTSQFREDKNPRYKQKTDKIALGEDFLKDQGFSVNKYNCDVSIAPHLSCLIPLQKCLIAIDLQFTLSHV